jgi:hypothetical protein
MTAIASGTRFWASSSDSVSTASGALESADAALRQVEQLQIVRREFRRERGVGRRLRLCGTAHAEDQRDQKGQRTRHGQTPAF